MSRSSPRLSGAYKKMRAGADAGPLRDLAHTGRFEALLVEERLGRLEHATAPLDLRFGTQTKPVTDARLTAGDGSLI